MKSFGFKSSGLMLAILLAILPMPAKATELELRLVCALDCSVEALSPFELRKLFLGLTVVQPGGLELTAIRNYSDDALKKVFHQTLMGMTEISYERKLLQSRMNFAAKEPAKLSDEGAVLEALNANQSALTFAWSTSKTINTENSRVIQVLWIGADSE